MNREQCQAILENLDLIRHFAQGGDIGHRLHDYRGVFVKLYPAKKINLGNLHPGAGTTYVKLKPKLRFNTRYGAWERVERTHYDNIGEHEVLPKEGT